ncbi:MAG: F0F1 ATP synthase subunit B [Cloacibacterium sp.]|nr:F0F1 ATP synthase subunit B [Cloacibacterium sp.]
MERLINDFSIGLFFWVFVIFLVIIFVMAKFAWKPILQSINDRETSIADALNQAKLARDEMQNLKAENERIIREAKVERDAILKEAREIKDKIVAEAKDVAKVEGDKMIEAAKHSIAMEKAAAMDDIKSQIGNLSVTIAETILKQKLEKSDAQNALVNTMLENKNLN